MIEAGYSYGEAFGTPRLLRAEPDGRTTVVASGDNNACHVGGSGALGPAINDKPLPVFLMRFQVHNGLGAMPAFPAGRISEAELDDLMAYLLALRRAGAPKG